LKIRWINWARDTTETLLLTEKTEGVFANSTISNGEKHLTIKYTLICKPSWKVKSLSLQLVETKKRLRLESDGHGNWSNDLGIMPKLHGAIDVDITATPYTNTLPIRRLKLEKGQHKEILVVYITIPELNVTIDRQRYTCLSKYIFLFEQINSKFKRKIEVDKDGLVLEYPGLFKRLE